MSVQFGKCNFDGKPVDPQDLERVRPVLAPYGPDGEGYICRDNFGILYRPFHATKESRRETQPHVSKSGSVITWDGRLDNREDLIGMLAGGLSPDSTDLETVAAGYERWGGDLFRRLIGDWACSVWNPKDQSLVLAKDFIGTRHLYYSFEGDRVSWCTILDPLILFADHCFTLEEEYIAGWLAYFPATHLTPYVGIHSVPPSSFVRMARGTERISKYWDFDSAGRICYHADAEYEEHFRQVFKESVRRRLRSDKPVLAELSGGMDSPSIVCTADGIIAEGSAECPRLDTLSYYNDTEPNWNERPYIAKVEEKRGRTGCHLDLGSDPCRLELKMDYLSATPGSLRFRSPVRERFADCVRSQGNRVVLSGTGGDEVAGGVPSPIPELADLLAEVRLAALCHQLRVWALSKRKPWLKLLWETAQRFLPTASDSKSIVHLAPWLNPGFTRRNSKALLGYPRRLKFFGPIPSFQENIETLEVLRRQLSSEPLATEPRCEIRYPFLDRQLVEFLYAIPREQLVRPGQRRSLMRRALRGIVPAELLNRPRKAYVEHGIMLGLNENWTHLYETDAHLELETFGIADGAKLWDALQNVRAGIEVPIITLMRTLGVELWLRTLRERNLLHPAEARGERSLPRWRVEWASPS